MSDELAMLDGAIAPALETVLPVTDQGFIRGDGAFEVIRVYEGAAFLMDEHLDRIERSAANLRLDGPVPRDLIASEAAELLERRGDGGPFDGALRVILTRGGRRLLITEPLPALPERLRLATVTYAPTRVLDGVKSLSYAGNMLCSRLARERGFDDAVLVTPHGRVLELPTASLFWVGEDGTLCTTPLSEHILASITRAHLMALLDVEERVITAEQLLEVREAFVASTAREVHPVAAIEDVEFEQVGEVTRKAAAAFSAHIDQLLGRVDG